jgi:thermitase
LPITGAYWATAEIDGLSRDVLWQCFERRCLIYAPDLEPGWQVFSSATGRHYFQWRYGED